MQIQNYCWLRMQFFFALLTFLCLSFSKLTAQYKYDTVGPITVAVGSEIPIVHAYPPFLLGPSVICRAGSDACYYPLMFYVHRLSGWVTTQLPVGYYLSSDTIFYQAFDSGLFIDTIGASYTGAGERRGTISCPEYDCSSSPIGEDVPYKIVYINTYWDSTVRVSKYLNTHDSDDIILSPKSVGRYDTVIIRNHLLNSINNSVVFSKWSIECDPGLPLTIEPFQDTDAVTLVTSTPAKKSIFMNYRISTPIQTTRYERNFNGIIKCHAQIGSLDSIFIKQVHFILKADPASTVSEPQASIDELNIYPNPSKGLMKVILTNSKTSEIDLSLFDLLGNKLQRLNKSRLNSGEYEYDLSLKKGVYYLRYKSESGIITKKIIIQ